jgi:hypothetical protein
MKKLRILLIALLVAAICLSIAACGKKSEPEPVEPDYTDTDPEPDDVEPEPDEDLPDISAFVGIWKYDSSPSYVVIDAARVWLCEDLYGKELGAGPVEAEDDGIALYLEDGRFVSKLTRIVGGLSDSDGDTMTKTDEMLLLPTPNDPLTETTHFESDVFGAVTLSYPRQMSAHKHPNVTNSVSFNAIMEDGTDDYYSNILFHFARISGYDPYMTQGAATAQPYMKLMMDGLAESMYSGKVIKCIGTDFEDCGSYYRIIGYLWLDGSIFSPAANQPVRGCMEVRYYGPTGYALVAMTISLESRIQNYFEICNNIMATCNYNNTTWTTAPKPVPAKPTGGSSHSDSGDYGTPYYWYDEDGDVWYWNGYENEFIGYGDDYYIDDDGSYYESNDYGWDYDDYDYYDDYDPWSDPGDYGWDW